MADLIDPSSDIERGSSRRTVLKGAAWATPAVIVATSAPAFAASGALTFTPGTTSIATSVVAGSTYYDFTFAGASVRSTGRILALELTLTVTFVPSGSSSNLLFKTTGNPTGWTSGSLSGSTSLVYVRSASSATGATVAFPNGTYFGTRFPVGTQEGTFSLTFSAAGAVSTTYLLKTPGAPARPVGSAAPRSLR